MAHGLGKSSAPSVETFAKSLERGGHRVDDGSHADRCRGRRHLTCDRLRRRRGGLSALERLRACIAFVSEPTAQRRRSLGRQDVLHRQERLERLDQSQVTAQAPLHGGIDHRGTASGGDESNGIGVPGTQVSGAGAAQRIGKRAKEAEPALARRRRGSLTRRKLRQDDDSEGKRDDHPEPEHAAHELFCVREPRRWPPAP